MFATRFGRCVLDALAASLIPAPEVIQAELSVQGHPWVHVDFETTLDLRRASKDTLKK